MRKNAKRRKQMAQANLKIVLYRIGREMGAQLFPVRPVFFQLYPLIR